MGRIFVVELEGRTYRCKYCKTHLSLADDIVSRAFHCRRGKAYLFSNVLQLWIEAIDIVTDIESKYLWEIGKLCTQGYHLLDLHKVANWPQESVISETLHGVNITVGPHEERMMLSGMHTVADIFCCCCGQIVGWKYEAAHEKNQKYKEGKFVLERGRIIDGLETEFYIDTHPNMSNAEDV